MPAARGTSDLHLGGVAEADPSDELHPHARRFLGTGG